MVGAGLIVQPEQHLILLLRGLHLFVGFLIGLMEMLRIIIVFI